MGTRHLTIVKAGGKLKVAQYGQWDGYPSGQGIDILKYLRSANLEKYQENLAKLPLITEEQEKIVDADPKWAENYPYLSRDCGSNIHKMVEDGLFPFVQHIETKEAEKWCEGFYTISFNDNQFLTEWRGKSISYPIDNLPTDEEYLSNFKGEDE